MALNPGALPAGLALDGSPQESQGQGSQAQGVRLALGVGVQNRSVQYLQVYHLQGPQVIGQGVAHQDGGGGDQGEEGGLWGKLEGGLECWAVQSTEMRRYTCTCSSVVVMPSRLSREIPLKLKGGR